MATTNAALIWNIANLLRWPYRPNQYAEATSTEPTREMPLTRGWTEDGKREFT